MCLVSDLDWLFGSVLREHGFQRTGRGDWKRAGAVVACVSWDFYGREEDGDRHVALAAYCANSNVLDVQGIHLKDKWAATELTWRVSQMELGAPRHWTVHDDGSFRTSKEAATIRGFLSQALLPACLAYTDENSLWNFLLGRVRDDLAQDWDQKSLIYWAAERSDRDAAELAVDRWLSSWSEADWHSFWSDYPDNDNFEAIRYADERFPGLVLPAFVVATLGLKPRAAQPHQATGTHGESALVQSREKFAEDLWLYGEDDLAMTMLTTSDDTFRSVMIASHNPDELEADPRQSCLISEMAALGAVQILTGTPRSLKRKRRRSEQCLEDFWRMSGRPRPNPNDGLTEAMHLLDNDRGTAMS